MSVVGAPVEGVDVLDVVGVDVLDVDGVDVLVEVGLEVAIASRTSAWILSKSGCPTGSARSTG